MRRAWVLLSLTCTDGVVLLIQQATDELTTRHHPDRHIRRWGRLCMVLHDATQQREQPRRKAGGT